MGEKLTSWFAQIAAIAAARPVAIDLLISPRDGSVQFTLRVLHIPAPLETSSQLSLHRAVFDDRIHVLATLLAHSPYANPNEPDVHGMFSRPNRC